MRMRERVSVVNGGGGMAVYNQWTGLVDWTTGLTDFH